MAFQKAVKGTALIGGGAIATVFGLSQFSQYRNKHKIDFIGISAPHSRVGVAMLFNSLLNAEVKEKSVKGT